MHMVVFLLNFYTDIFRFNIIFQACLGKRSCTVPVWTEKFYGDPCPGIPKALLVDAQCT